MLWLPLLMRFSKDTVGPSLLMARREPAKLTQWKSGQFNENAGVIPRAVQQIFDILEGEHADYSVKVTYLELYNEEVTDLLVPDEESRGQLVLMEDGKGSVFVRGLEEEIVFSADEIYEILEKGATRKRTATIFHNRSNRAHSILSITVQIKELSAVGSELIKWGKLNLVDLAGSENILRWGGREAINVIAREAGEINKSLLTLSRVINALAENSAHVPYRDSKLTRLLRDSLGGTAKACIIATASQSILSQEETLCTLDIASRARNIKNRPEMNRKVMKSTVLKDLYTQIDILKRELRVKRESNESNGVYVSHDNNQRAEERTKKQLMELQEMYLIQQQFTEDLKDKLESTERELIKTRQSLRHLEDEYQQAKDVIKDKETMIHKILCSGKALTERALEFRSDLEGAASDVSTLLARIEHKTRLEDSNRDDMQNFYTQLAKELDELSKVVSSSAAHQEQKFEVVQDETRSFVTSKSEATNELLKQIQTLKDLYASGVKQLDDSAEEMYRRSQLGFGGLSNELSIHSSCAADLVVKSSSITDSASNDLKLNLHSLRSCIDAFIKQQQENHVRTYDGTRSISYSLLNFFETLRIYISKLTLMQEDSRTVTTRKISDFTKKFKDFALDEELLLVDKITELLASSRTRKEKMIQAAADDIIDSTRTQHSGINQEISEMQISTVAAEENWTNYIQKMEANCVEDSAVVEAGKSILGDDLQCCIIKSTKVAKQYRVAEESLLHVLEENAKSVDSFIKNVTEDIEIIKAQYSSVASSILEETNGAGENAMSSVECLAKLDHEATEKFSSMSRCFLDGTREMNSFHSEKVAEISRNARKSLVEDYLVDDSSDLSPRKRDFKLASKESIEGLMNVCVGNSLELSHSPPPDINVGNSIEPCPN
ncbi:kinesin-like protein KIN-5D isoform X2 [Andrographis paniculata]|uniref:kinesin-like protein KIN-5D isoform X2 n=1 Tax=Andrographis paniculata TaxID=175694 RepID=UPI0021E70C39|nr:kinesin-like protein KIN-5D isoform X2 [Andrographis paniculata]